MTEPAFYTPSDRDILVSLLDGLMALSERLFPQERMVIKLIDTKQGGRAFAYATGTTLTEWEPR